MTLLYDFVRESNRIEGITRLPQVHEIEAHNIFMGEESIHTGDFVRFVQAVQPGALLRSNVGMNVMVGRYVAPDGGDNIVNDLAKLLKQQRDITPFDFHRKYLTLHPFTDGNGRSARAMWLYMLSVSDLLRVKKLGFLHTFYYQTLAAHDERVS